MLPEEVCKKETFSTFLRLLLKSKYSEKSTKICKNFPLCFSFATEFFFKWDIFLTFCDLFTISELFLDRISSKRTFEQCTLTVHSEYTYIEERIASKQSKSAQYRFHVETELLFGAGAVSVLPESRENAQVNSYQEQKLTYATLYAIHRTCVISTWSK